MTMLQNVAHGRPRVVAMLSDGTESQSVMTVLVFKVRLELHMVREPKPPT